jgi:excisionase family DNA binding protein
VRQRCSACPSYEWHGLIVEDGDIFPLHVCGWIFDCVLRTNLAYVCSREHEEAQMTNDRLHDIREAAARLAVSPWTVRRLIDRAELRGVRVGRRVLVSEREILRVIQHGTGGRKRRRVSR